MTCSNLLPVRSLFRPLVQRLEERLRFLRRLYQSGEGSPGWHHATVKIACAVFVLLDDRAIECDASKEPPGPRVGKNLGTHLPVGIALGVAADRAGSGAGIGPQLELTLQQILHAVLVHD